MPGPAQPTGDASDGCELIRYALCDGCLLHQTIEIGACFRPELEFGLDCKQRTNGEHYSAVKQAFVVISRHCFTLTFEYRPGAVPGPRVAGGL